MLPSTTVCHAANGTCDVAEFCDGVNKTRGADKLQEAGYVCRATDDKCDLVEVCDGESRSCPEDKNRDHGYTIK